MGGRDDYQNYMGGEDMGDDDTDGEGEPPMKTVLIIGETREKLLLRSPRTASTTRREVKHRKEQSRQKHNPRVRVLRKSCVRCQRPLTALTLLKNSMAPTPGN